MKSISLEQKYAVLHCVFQVVYATFGNVDEERDEEIIDSALTALGFSSIYAWDKAAALNAHDCFLHVSQIDVEFKKSVHDFLNSLPAMSSQPQVCEQCVDAIVLLCNLNT